MKRNSDRGVNWSGDRQQERKLKSEKEREKERLERKTADRSLSLQSPHASDLDCHSIPSRYVTLRIIQSIN